MNPRLFLVPTFVACLAYVGCGGGGDGTPAPTEDLIVDFHYSRPTSLSRFIGVQMLPASRTQTSGKSCTYTLVAGSLPPGLTLNAGTGALQGNPTQKGTYNATVQLTVAGYRGAVQTSVDLSVVDPQLFIGEVNPYYISLGSYDRIDALLTYVPGQTPKTAVLRLMPADGGGFNTTHTTVETSYTGPMSFRTAGDVPLPDGVSLNATTGRVTFAPTQPGISELKFEATATIGGSTYTFAGKDLFICLGVFRRQGGTNALTVEMPVRLQGGATPTLESGAEGTGSFYCTFAFADGKAVLSVDEAQVKDLPPGGYASRNMRPLNCGSKNFWLRGYLTVDTPVLAETRY